MVRFVPFHLTALGSIYDYSTRRKARQPGDEQAVAAERVPKLDLETIATLKCPDCRQVLACSRWHPSAVSTLKCTRGCGTYRYQHRLGLLRRSSAVYQPASGDCD